MKCTWSSYHNTTFYRSFISSIKEQKCRIKTFLHLLVIQPHWYETLVDALCKVRLTHTKYEPLLRELELTPGTFNGGIGLCAFNVLLVLSPFSCFGMSVFATGSVISLQSVSLFESSLQSLYIWLPQRNSR